MSSHHMVRMSKSCDGTFFAIALALGALGPSAVGESVEAGETMSGWYPFNGHGAVPAASVWRMDDWLDAPAGRLGRIRSEGDSLVYGGRAIRLWGLNLSYAACAPETALADRRADFYAALGINAVRLHKYADGEGWAGILAPGESTRFDDAALARMDYFVAALKRRGIYVNLSPVFIIKPGVGERDRLPFFDELGPVKGGRVNPGHGAFYLSTELQDILADQAKAFLNHRNPHTGLTYAEDPAVAFFELYNEDSALFYGVASAMERSGGLRARGAAAFQRWLAERYGGEQALLRAWGADALNSDLVSHLKLPLDESWAEGRVYPAGNPWFFDPDQLRGSQARHAVRLRDTMEFLHELQNRAYARLVKAVRETGYAGEIIASNWQAGRMASHYLNLQSDVAVGPVDRHNYFGGGQSRDGGEVRTAAMVSRPGGGMLSSGMQQVAGRPFMLSEWIHVLPTEWGAEGPALIGAYGMGLQGWDASFAFQNSDTGTFLERFGRTPWEVTAPQFLGLFPAVSRQVLRGDVSEAGVRHVRHVHLPSLLADEAGFDERMAQDHDIKTMESDVLPQEGIALVKAEVAFGDTRENTPVFDSGSYRRGGLLHADGGQLRWRPGDNPCDGHVEIDTAGTQAVVGFAKGRRIALHDVIIESDSRFAAIYVSALSPDGTVANDRLLITAIARARNDGQVMEGAGRILRIGAGAIHMEPVKGRLTFGGRVRVVPLSHLGVPAEPGWICGDGIVNFDTALDASPYYLVERIRD